MTPQTAEERKAYNRRWYLAHRAGNAVEAPPDIEAEAAEARAREIEVATTRVIAQLSDLTVNWWHKVGSCSSADIAGIVAATLNGRYQRDGRTVIRCQSRDTDLYLLRQATVTQ